MSIATEQPTDLTNEPKPSDRGFLASFTSVESLLAAIRSLREDGLQNLEVHSPHPIHGLEKELPARTSILPLGATVGATAGLAGGLWMAWWMNAVDYPFIISGKPLFAIVPSLPVAFELAILLAAFAVFGGALALGGLPAFANRKFRVPAFARATSDRYFLSIESVSLQASEDDLRDNLTCLGALEVHEIPIEDTGERRIPPAIWMASAVLLLLALIPPVLIAKARYSTSTKPRISIISDMDHQPKFKTQTTNPLFADGRTMRPQVAGTIARGDLQNDGRFYRGIQPKRTLEPAVQTSLNEEIFVNFQETNQPPTENTTPDWVTEFPVSVDEPFIRRGQERFNIYCATCHGIGGDGDGLATLRALELEQGTWVKPTSLHAEPIREQPLGQLFNTITNGVRKMPGYASQIPVEDRWAIVAYVKALQKTRTGTSEEVPDDVLPTLRELK